jgi:hypothetical protein
MSRLARSICGAVVGLALSVGTVAAAPTSVDVSVHSSQPHFLACPDFSVRLEIDVSRRITTFYDAAGAPIRMVLHVTGSGTLSNPLSGKSLPDEGHFTRTIDLVTGTATFSGAMRVDTAPGVGVVFQAVGRVTFGPDGSIQFEAGPHDDLDGNLGAICADLA